MQGVSRGVGSVPVSPPTSSLMADKLWETLNRRQAEGETVHTIGAIDPVQVGSAIISISRDSICHFSPHNLGSRYLSRVAMRFLR